MKTLSAALAAALLCCLAGAGTAAAVTPKKGTWSLKLDGAPKPPGGRSGSLKVISKKGKLYVTNFVAPDHYVKCSGPGAQAEEVNPGFSTTFSTARLFKLGRKATFSRTDKFKAGRNTRLSILTGKFTSKGKAKGTIRSRITGDPRRSCDSGALKWKASK